MTREFRKKGGGELKSHWTPKQTNKNNWMWFLQGMINKTVKRWSLLWCSLIALPPSLFQPFFLSLYKRSKSHTDVVWSGSRTQNWVTQTRQSGTNKRTGMGHKSHCERSCGQTFTRNIVPTFSFYPFYFFFTFFSTKKSFCKFFILDAGMERRKEGRLECVNMTNCMNFSIQIAQPFLPPPPPPSTTILSH